MIPPGPLIPMFPALTLAQTAQAAQTAPTGGVSVLELIAAGGTIAYLIIALSIAALALVVMHMMQLRESALAPPDLIDELDELLSRGEVDAAARFCRDEEHDCFLTRVIDAGMTRCKRSVFGWLELKGALEEAGQEQVARLYRSTDGLGLIAAIAPMLGLLGTVVGMVGAFDTISATEGFARPDQLAGNISKALVTTLMGLSLAIPATAAFTFFRNRIDALSVEVASTIEDLAAHLDQAGASAERDRPA